MLRRLVCAVVLLLALPASASAYRLDRTVVPQPKLRYFVALPDWKRPFDRVVKALNAAHVGVRLVKAKIPEQASIQIGRLQHRCELPGVDGVTQTIKGGYAAIYLPIGCKGTIASVIAAHELGHALGLKHEDRRCALMNSSGTGRDAIPTHCLGKGFDWLRHPFRSDDVAGLKRLYRNTAPKARLRLAEPSQQVTAGRQVAFSLRASDRERNISELTIDFGDGSREQGFKLADLPHAHSYLEAGTYTARLSVVDYYGRRATSSVTVTVTA